VDDCNLGYIIFYKKMLCINDFDFLNMNILKEVLETYIYTTVHYNIFLSQFFDFFQLSIKIFQKVLN
jgi:hypothetical protein